MTAATGAASGPYHTEGNASYDGGHMAGRLGDLVVETIGSRRVDRDRRRGVVANGHVSGESTHLHGTGPLEELLVGGCEVQRIGESGQGSLAVAATAYRPVGTRAFNSSNQFRTTQISLDRSPPAGRAIRNRSPSAETS